eukprot:scaffold6068_cov119-Isochrysis_galbana.AAC.9
MARFTRPPERYARSARGRHRVLGLGVVRDTRSVPSCGPFAARAPGWAVRRGLPRPGYNC